MQESYQSRTADPEGVGTGGGIAEEKPRGPEKGPLRGRHGAGKPSREGNRQGRNAQGRC